MTEPKVMDPNIPTVLWRGQRWPVPNLAARQLDEVYELIQRLTEVLRQQDGGAPTADEAELERRGQETLGKLYNFTGSQFRELRHVVWVGLKRAHPDLSQDEFDDAPTSPLEMLLAFFEVRRASRMYESLGREAPKSSSGEEPARSTGDI